MTNLKPSCFRRLVNLFNRTLAVLAVIDNIFIACDLLESLRRFRPVPSHNYAATYALLPMQVQNIVLLFLKGDASCGLINFFLQNMAMVASIYITVVIALERYIAVSRPISTYVSGGDDEGILKAWLRVLKYVGPVILFSVVINISTFFEFVIKEGKIYPSLRLNEDYIKYYINMFREGITSRQNLLCHIN